MDIALWTWHYRHGTIDMTLRKCHYRHDGMDTALWTWHYGHGTMDMAIST